jgi:hypothetical protein
MASTLNTLIHLPALRQFVLTLPLRSGGPMARDVQTRLWGLGTIVVGVLAFWIGRHSVGTRSAVRSAAASLCEGGAASRESDVDSRRERRPVAPQPLALPLVTGSAARAGDDPETVAEARGQRAGYLLGEVFSQLEFEARKGTTPAEARASAVLPYLSGALHGALQADPGIRAAFSEQFTAALCDRALADDALISVAHMALILPDVGTTRGFDCFFSHAKEEVPLWSMLDAWRRSGLEKTPALERLRASSTDPRTLRRFLSNEEAMAQRAGGDRVK